MYYSIWDGVSWSQPQFLFPVGYWEDFHFKIYNDIIHLVWAGSWNGVQGIYYTWKDAITGINQSADAQQNASITIKNFPNPFNDETNIQYKIYRVGKVKIEIFNIIGEKVQTLVDEVRTPGTYNAKFYANELSSGIYLCQISAETEKKVVKLFLVK
ncbi:MAG: T9SS type A sorting domain-containing protein [Aliifodinibius sp.]|nr:T9SS type A sorting domain-containing protein [Fodinibius sp.]NIV12013.1 T9SS type A sorting domain-containing protein [Fodinibius sp.]NIY25658.1 T9SS type A sorting domain-containing protein [Fodinibius sp.]